MSSTVNRVIKIFLSLLVATLVCVWPATAQGAEPQLYPDVPTDSEHAAAIYRLSQFGLLRGGSTGFAPDAYLTRASFAAVACRLNGVSDESLSLYATMKSPFTDVADSAWYKGCVVACYDLGLMRGFGGDFLPESTATRQELVTVIMRALGYSRLDGAWPQNYLDKAADIGLIDWRSDGEPATRAEMAEMIDRALELELVYHVEDEAAAEVLRGQGLIVDEDGYIRRGTDLLGSVYNCTSMPVTFSDLSRLEENGRTYLFYTTDKGVDDWSLMSPDCFSLIDDLQEQKAVVTLNAAGQIVFIRAD